MFVLPQWRHFRAWTACLKMPPWNTSVFSQIRRAVLSDGNCLGGQLQFNCLPNVCGDLESILHMKYQVAMFEEFVIFFISYKVLLMKLLLMHQYLLKNINGAKTRKDLVFGFGLESLKWVQSFHVLLIKLANPCEGQWMYIFVQKHLAQRTW